MPRPNPGHGRTTLDFELPATAYVTLDMFDLRGRRITRLADGMLGAGRHSVTWSGLDGAGHAAGAGVFFVRLEANGTCATTRMVRLGRP